ncbi:copper chaperone PCu(A)C [Montanilutibacter psychrotolerans]|uniref:Copper chaperone PCu(A)C n=1 Tax=Montanilutibacter psychrotolerans TaxID=1327343 RepID=A0A3M8T0L5_9GAMM|nr:copper chaperone PCu(A)C [Lysobacter psychrotolerans]RNF85064.1 copper chaperone PCu(A)C [Lysobacter psychrotolerans]
MNSPRASIVLAVSLIAAAFLPAGARACTPTISEGWVRMPPAQMPMLAGFARIENRCATPVTIVGASSPSFADTSLHETRIVDGISRMRAMPELRIAPDGVAVLKPGGMHLMLMRPTAPLRPGSKVVVEFALKEGGVLRGEFDVRRPGQ